MPGRLAAALERAHRDGTLERLTLGALTRAEARALVGADADELYDETGGNAFYLEQLARASRTPAAAAAASRSITSSVSSVEPGMKSRP